VGVRWKEECSAILSDALKHELLTRQGEWEYPLLSVVEEEKLLRRGNVFEIRCFHELVLAPELSHEFVLAPVVGVPS